MGTGQVERVYEVGHLEVPTQPAELAIQELELEGRVMTDQDGVRQQPANILGDVFE